MSTLYDYGLSGTIPVAEQMPLFASFVVEAVAFGKSRTGNIAGKLSLIAAQAHIL
jgi:hypothetical protein